MKTIVLVALAVIVAVPATLGQTIIIPRNQALRAQYLAPRQYMRRLNPAPARQAPPSPAQTPAQRSAATNAPPQTVSPAPPPLTTAPAVDPEKAREEKDAVVRRTVEFQKQRAEDGSPSAQYDMGRRYMTGDGVDKNLAEARKWLEASAKQGNDDASAKLEELKKLEKEANAPAK